MVRSKSKAKSKAKVKSKRKKWALSKIKKTFSIMKEIDYDSKIYNLVKKESDNMYLKVGSLEIDKKTACIESSELNKNLRGKGIGKYLYEQALLDNKKLATNPSSTSDLAKRLHRSLMKKWEHKHDPYGDINRGGEGYIIYYPKLLKKQK